jgi:hypothetical protein
LLLTAIFSSTRHALGAQQCCALINTWFQKMKTGVTTNKADFKESELNNDLSSSPVSSLFDFYYRKGHIFKIIFLSYAIGIHE